MLNIVVSVLFKIISILSALFLTPILAILTPIMSVFGFADFVPYFFEYLNTALTYVNFFVVALHIPLAPFVLVVSICGVLIVFNISMRAVLMVLSIYKAYKGTSNNK